MSSATEHWRSDLARRITELHRADAQQILARLPPIALCPTIGFTGAPGAGKSSLIAALAEHRLSTGRRIAVLAIDPTSPSTGGSVLGDRIRMQDIRQVDRLFVRSLPSGSLQDGMCRNLLGIIGAVSEAGFDEVFVETVGVGQITHVSTRILDATILVLAPGMGDDVQAMKAGVLELADILAVNKADLPEAARTAAEVGGVLKLQAPARAAPPLVLTSSAGAGVEALSEAIDLCLVDGRGQTRQEALRRRRRRYLLHALMSERLEALLTSDADVVDDRLTLPEAYAELVRRLA